MKWTTGEHKGTISTLALVVDLGWGLQWLSKRSARVVLCVQRGENYTRFWDPSSHLKQRLWADSLWTEMCLFYFWSGLNNSSFFILFHPYCKEEKKKRQKTLMLPFGSSGGERWILATFFKKKTQTDKRTLINRSGSFKQFSATQGRQICPVTAVTQKQNKHKSKNSV